MKSAIDPSTFVAFESIVVDTDDLFRLTDDLGQIERFLYKGGEGTISQKAQEILSPRLMAIFSDLEKAGVEGASDKEQSLFLRELNKHLNDLPSFKLTLAFEPTKTFIASLNRDLSLAVGKKVVLDIVVNQNIIAGVIFEYEGRLFSSTLEAKLNESITKHTTRAKLT